MDKKKENPLDKLKDGIEQAGRIVQMSYSRTHPEVIKVLLIGRTGAGKTLLLHSLAGKKLHGISYDGRIKLDVEECDRLKGDTGEFKVGHNIDAETFYPNRFLMTEYNMELFDNPGIADTDIDKRAINAYATDSIIGDGGKIVILLVISESDFYDKADKASDTFDMICTMFPDHKQLKTATCLIITKTIHENPKKYVDELAGSKDRKNYLVDFLSRKKDSRVFLLPSASGTGDYCFEDRDKVLKFIRKNPVDNPKHNMALDPAGRIRLSEMIQPFEDEKEQLVKNVTDLFKNAAASENDVNELRKWQEYTKMSGTAAHEGYEQFVKCIENLANKEPCFQSFSQSFLKLQPWDSFLARACDPSTTQSLKNDISKLMETVVMLLSNYENMLNSKATQAETVNKMKKEIDALNDQVAQGQATVEEFKQKEQEMEIKMKKIDEENKKNTELHNETVESLQHQIQKLEEENKISREKLIEENNKKLEEMKKQYNARIDELKKPVRCGPSNGELIVDLVKTIGPPIIDYFKNKNNNSTTYSDSLPTPDYPFELRNSEEVHQIINDDTSDPESDPDSDDGKME